jgi:hypothetical protein
MSQTQLWERDKLRFTLTAISVETYKPPIRSLERDITATQVEEV